MRYADGEYFFILDTEHHFLMHAAKPAQDGKSAAELRDPSGKLFIQELVRVALSTAQGGIVDYSFAKPGSEKPVPKLSYTAQFKPWGWVIGTGLYLDDVDQTFRSEATNEISTMVLSVQADTETAAGAMGEAAPQVKRSLDRAREANDLLEAIHSQAHESSERVQEVAAATREQATVANDIARHVQNIASMTEETNATMQGTADSATALNDLAERLRAAVAYFRLA